MMRMASDSPTPQPAPREINIRVQEINQLFNTMDPSPFHEKDLDDNADEYIVSSAEEFHIREPLALIVHLGQAPQGPDPQPMLEEAVHNHYSARAAISRLEFRRLMRDGRRSLLIGFAFLCLCLGIGQLVVRPDVGTFRQILGEGLTIAGWVAMWRPFEIYLYDWWPERRRMRLFRKMSEMPVRVLQQQATVRAT